MEIKNNSGFIVMTGFLIGIVRLLLSRIEDPNVVLLVMAAVNYIAIFLIIKDIQYNVVLYCKEKVNSSGLDTQTKTILKDKLKLPYYIFIVVYLVVGLLYITFLKTTDLNDFISIIALSLSIAATGLTNSIKQKCFKAFIKKNLEDTP